MQLFSRWPIDENCVTLMMIATFICFVDKSTCIFISLLAITFRCIQAWLQFHMHTGAHRARVSFLPSALSMQYACQQKYHSNTPCIGLRSSANPPIGQIERRERDRKRQSDKKKSAHRRADTADMNCIVEFESKCQQIKQCFPLWPQMNIRIYNIFASPFCIERVCVWVRYGFGSITRSFIWLIASRGQKIWSEPMPSKCYFVHSCVFVFESFDRWMRCTHSIRDTVSAGTHCTYQWIWYSFSRSNAMLTLCILFDSW